MQLSKQQKQFVGQLLAYKAKPAAAAPRKPKRATRQPVSPAQRPGRGGDSLSAPVSLGYTRPPIEMRSMAPSRRGGEVRIVGCDYVGSIGTNAISTVDNVYPLNVRSTTFPRLSAIAAVFGKHAFNRLRFYAVGKAASTLAGDMTSVTVYDGTGGGGTLTETQVKNRYRQVTSKFWENHVHEVDCSKASVPWFVSEEASATPSDTTNLGFFHFFTEAASSGPQVADLFVCYDVELCEAQASGDTD
jgi:hypothetical protein